jgi:D-alanyl-D-alanine carboxypeptidase
MKFIITLLLVVNTAWARNEPSLLLHNTNTGHTLISQNAQEQRPLASITKLMTAMVALDHSKDLFRQLPLNTTVKSNLLRGNYTRQELFTAMLVRSDSTGMPSFRW